MATASKDSGGDKKSSRKPELSLPELQSRLNEDVQAKKAFLKDPSGTLQGYGYELNPEQERTLGYLVDRVKRPGQMVPGAGIAPQDLSAITITIGVDF
jgi:hypothetical protein